MSKISKKILHANMRQLTFWHNQPIVFKSFSNVFIVSHDFIDFSIKFYRNGFLSLRRLKIKEQNEKKKNKKGMKENV